MKVIILVAGRGERLMPLTKNTPKSLLELGNGETILENQLNALNKSGLQDVVLVLGYKAEQVEAKIKDIKDFNIKVVYNPFYDITNNLVSAWMAREAMKEDFILLNGDVIFKHTVMKNLLPDEKEICMIIDRKERYSEEDMKVVTKGDTVLEVSKKIAIERANGESIGMIKFQGKGRHKFVTVIEEMVRSKENLNLFYLSVIQKIIDDGFPVHYCECLLEDWLEIDFHPDLRSLRNNIDRFSQIIKHW
jgi:choline kinase